MSWDVLARRAATRTPVAGKRDLAPGPVPPPPPIFIAKFQNADVGPDTANGGGVVVHAEEIIKMAAYSKSSTFRVPYMYYYNRKIHFAEPILPGVGGGAFVVDESR